MSEVGALSKRDGVQRPGLRQRQREAVAAELREAALRMFRDRGFDDVSVGEIATEAGMSERTFFRYFPTKEEVVLKVMESYGATIMARAERMPLESSWFELLRGVYDLRGAPGATYEELRTVYALALSSPKLMAGVAIRQRVWVRDIAEIIAKRLEVDVDLDPRPVAWATVAISITLAEIMRTVANGQDLDGTEPIVAWSTLPELMGL